VDLPRSFTIRESSHRILNPFTPEKLAVLGAALRLRSGASLLDLCSGKGELLCTWAAAHGITGTGVDVSTVFVAATRERAAALGVARRFRWGDGV
jgi:cyclopropane fatty-acyl-phospholipid synthase-like methyltransferase